MWPVVLIAAATAAAQMYQSEKARGADRARLKELEAQWDKLVPPGFDVSIQDPPRLIQERLPEPSFDMQGITPEQYKLVGIYRPDIAPFVAQANPRLVEDSGDGLEGKRAQMDALRRLKGIAADGGGDPTLLVGMQQAERRAQAAAQSRQNSILSDAERRGQLGSGTMLASQMQSGADAMGIAAQSGQNAAVEAYKNRLQALRDSAQLGGQIRGEDLNVSGRNAAIINDFNQRGAERRQSWEQQRVGALNEGQRYNLTNQQSLSNMNTEAANQAKYKNLSRQDALSQYLYGIRSGERDYQNNVQLNQAKWKAGERDNQNDLKQKAFQNSVTIQGGKQGLGIMNFQNERQNSQDRNQQVQGFGNAAASGYQAQADQQRADSLEKDQQRAQDRREYFRFHGKWPEDEQAV